LGFPSPKIPNYATGASLSWPIPGGIGSPLKISQSRDKKPSNSYGGFYATHDAPPKQGRNHPKGTQAEGEV
jgi:hypothetical protein